MKAVNETGALVSEPNWALILTDDIDIVSAQDQWRRVTTELRERDLLAPANGHAIQRLVMSYITYDACAREVADNGAVLKPKRGNPKAIARLSPFFTAMRESGSDCERLEAELGISPRRRNGAGKVVRNARKTTASAGYLKQVGK